MQPSSYSWLLFYSQSLSVLLFEQANATGFIKAKAQMFHTNMIHVGGHFIPTTKTASTNRRHNNKKKVNSTAKLHTWIIQGLYPPYFVLPLFSFIAHRNAFYALYVIGIIRKGRKTRKEIIRRIPPVKLCRYSTLLRATPKRTRLNWKRICHSCYSLPQNMATRWRI